MEIRVKEEVGVECTRCSGFRDKIVKAENKCDFLEFDICLKDTEIKVLKRENLELQDEINVLKSKNDDLKKSLQTRYVELEEKVTDLMIENNVLECEKNKAESDVGVWKEKCGELEVLLNKMGKGVRVSGMDLEIENEEVNEDEDRAGTRKMETPSKHSTDPEQGCRREVSSRTRRRIAFSSEGSQQKNIFPTTPRTRSSVAHDDISGSGADLNRMQVKKRKLANRVTSDSENESDDNIPFSKLKSKNLPEGDGDIDPDGNLNDFSSSENVNRSTRKRRLIKQGNRDKEKDSENSSRRRSTRIANLKNVISDEEGTEEDEWETESMDGFIVSDDADASECDSPSNSEEIPEKDDTSSAENSGNLHSESEGSMEYGEIISSLRREKRGKLKWDYEADMLADFGKSPELCMKAVCALYRQQTSEEQSSKACREYNGRGFSNIDAYKGSDLAEFLTYGDSQGDVIKTVEELLEYDPKGVELCRKYATHYSRQLFEIYENNEDPYFRP